MKTYVHPDHASVEWNLDYQADLWVAAATAALAGFAARVDLPIEDTDFANLAGEFADHLLREFQKRFDSRYIPKTARAK